jgi:hypothetical protein
MTWNARATPYVIKSQLRSTVLWAFLWATNECSLSIPATVAIAGVATVVKGHSFEVSY